MDEINDLYSEHLKSSFPANLRGQSDQDLILLDANIIGCVSVYLQNKGMLDDHRIEILKSLVSEIDNKTIKIPEDAKAYYFRLQRLGKLVLNDTQV